MATNLQVDDKLILKAVKLGRDKTKKAARYFNLCRSKGVQGSNTDFLICSVVECQYGQRFVFSKI